ncbi:hypothetical protein H0H87_008064 [Tephrocybe sp. NHM501043]|nr:hypothetical protein H0H87_008064 [Tephrocybe sp. NHM501043]
MAYVRAKYRWMLTGTPVTNTLADIYGLLRFGRFRPWNDWLSFDEHVAKVQFTDAPLAGEHEIPFHVPTSFLIPIGSRAQAILKPILLRRTKDSTLEGKPILELPPKSIEILKLEFSEDERDLYDSFEKRTKVRLNKFIRERTLVSNHAAVLVMILRLRQLCCHPNLILSQTEGYEDPTLLVGSDSDKELARAKKIMGGNWVSQIKQRSLTRRRASELLDFSDEAAPESNCPVCQEYFMNDNGLVLTCTHEICFDCLMDLRNSAIVHNGIFGEGSEKENIEAEKEYESAAARGYRPCPTCKKMIDLTPNKTFKASAFEPTNEELTNHACKTRRNKGGRRISGRDVRMRSPTPEKSFEDHGLSDSDDDLPDVSTFLEDRPVKRQKRSKVVESDDDDNEALTNLTLDQISQPLNDIKMGSTSDSEIEFIGPIDTKPNRGSSISPHKRTATAIIATKKRARDGAFPSDAVIATWRRGGDDLEPSAKMNALIELLQEWEITGDKTIVYSQWTSMLDLLDILFSRYGIQSLRFDGKMDRIARDQVLSTFKKPGGPKVILISTKCGSVGLNLVSANRIINMDLSWNYAAESQAYDRVHRIGQEKDVIVKRLVVDNTIEERMLRLQDVKTGLAEAALGEGSGAKLHKLSVKDIKYVRSLFIQSCVRAELTNTPAFQLFGMAPATNPPANGQAPRDSSP